MNKLKKLLLVSIILIVLGGFLYIFWGQLSNEGILWSMVVLAFSILLAFWFMIDDELSLSDKLKLVLTFIILASILKTWSIYKTPEEYVDFNVEKTILSGSLEDNSGNPIAAAYNVYKLKFDLPTMKRIKNNTKDEDDNTQITIEKIEEIWANTEVGGVSDKYNTLLDEARAKERIGTQKYRELRSDDSDVSLWEEIIPFFKTKEQSLPPTPFAALYQYKTNQNNSKLRPDEKIGLFKELNKNEFYNKSYRNMQKKVNKFNENLIEELKKYDKKDAHKYFDDLIRLEQQYEYNVYIDPKQTKIQTENYDQMIAQRKDLLNNITIQLAQNDSDANYSLEELENQLQGEELIVKVNNSSLTQEELEGLINLNWQQTDNSFKVTVDETNKKRLITRLKDINFICSLDDNYSANTDSSTWDLFHKSFPIFSRQDLLEKLVDLGYIKLSDNGYDFKQSAVKIIKMNKQYYESSQQYWNAFVGNLNHNLKGSGLIKNLSQNLRRINPSKATQIQEFIKGEDLNLTLKQDVQDVLYNKITEKFTSDDLTENNPLWASGVIMDNKGQILGAVSHDTTENQPVFKDRIFKTPYTPGSVLKPLIIYNAMQDDKIDFDDEIDVRGKYHNSPHATIDNKTISTETGEIASLTDLKIHLEESGFAPGTVDLDRNSATIKDIIAYSSNMGLSRIAESYLPLGRLEPETNITVEEVNGKEYYRYKYNENPDKYARCLVENDRGLKPLSLDNNTEEYQKDYKAGKKEYWESIKNLLNITYQDDIFRSDYTKVKVYQEYENWLATRLVNFSYGKGIHIYPIQVVTAYIRMLKGDLELTPKLTADKVVEETNGNRVTPEPILKGMRKVVERGTAGHISNNIAQGELLGKTGTSTSLSNDLSPRLYEALYSQGKEFYKSSSNGETNLFSQRQRPSDRSISLEEAKETPKRINDVNIASFVGVYLKQDAGQIEQISQEDVKYIVFLSFKLDKATSGGGGYAAPIVEDIIRELESSSETQ